MTRPVRGLVYLLTLVFVCSVKAATSNTEKAVYHVPTQKSYILWYRNYDSPAIYALVKLAMEKTPEYGPFSIQRSAEMVQGRALRELTRGGEGTQVLDIAAVATSVEREKELGAVPIPIDGGLLGFRVCVVMKDQVDRFEGVEGIEDLRARGLRIGQGLHWPDTTVLQVNGIDVISHSRYETLFLMLKNRRFDCFARGVSEVIFDLELEDDPQLVIEPSLLITYPMLSYFFVAPEDHDTAHRLQLGMERAIEDGSFGRFLDSYFGQALKNLNLSGRKILVLDNPYLSGDSMDVGRQALESLRTRIDAY
ncbi:MAG: hypothetical protein R3175_03250 [Marinobacter sp.]|uniref:hypothetical protein n=1 Tax=Marinobacter sp. TaxID=50741 RepID=UPI00299D484E|nr:hypothetical protein [Marinobacter sp.]MDX1755055.1 hypothetical protein [Marinobacter sp.]